MASGRFISSTLGDSERFSSLTDPRYQVAFVLIVTWADAEGRFIADPITLNGKLFTRLGWTPDLVRAALDELHDVGLITLYQVDGKPYGVVQKFHQHNTITRKQDGSPAREAASKLPPPPEPLGNHSTQPAQQVSKASAPTDEQLHNDRAATTPEVEVEVQVEHQVQEPRAHAREAGARQEGKKGNQAKLGDFDASKIALPDHVTPDVWASFVKHRNQKRKPLTEESTREILQLLDQHPLDADKMLRQTIAAGWTRVFPLDKPRAAGSGPAAEAWEHILDAARKGKPPQDLDKTAAAALKAIGGWSAVAYCPEPYLAQRRANFLNAYDDGKGKRGKEAA